MKTNYSWETEDESEWEATTSPNPEPGRHPRRALLLLGLAVVIGCAVIIFLANNRLKRREELVRQNVVAAHQTWEQAVTRQDLELFSSLITRADNEWYQSQRRLLMSGRILDRDSFGLSESGTVITAPDIILDSNWRRAEVTFPRTYKTKDGNSEQQVSLMMTQVYQLRGSRWQVAKPTEEYWGNLESRQVGRLIISYPQRDSKWVWRLAEDLSREVDEICNIPEFTGACPSDRFVKINFDTDPESLLALGDLTIPVLNGQTNVLPSPSLVGLPADEKAYFALYQGYADRVLVPWRNNLALPIPLPDQDIAALCFPAYDQGVSLFTYRPAANTWTQQSEPRRYSFLQSLPNDSGLVLRGGFPGVELAHLELTLQRDGRQIPIFKEGTTELSVRLDGIPARPQSDSLILSWVQGSTGLKTYRLLPLESCEDGACELSDLAGFPVWTPDGNSSLVLIGADLFIGDRGGVPLVRIGRGFSPFWLTNDIFGFVRLKEGRSIEGLEMELVLRSSITGKEWIITNSAGLLDSIGAVSSRTFRIMYVTANPNHANQIIVAGTPVTGGVEQFYVLGLTLNGDVATLPTGLSLYSSEVLLSLDDLPVGDPTTLTPTGYPPFSITPDGRWLVVTRFADSITNTWVLYLHDIDQNETKVLTLNYPAYPAPFPFFDWSADNQWLVLVDNGFLRLVAPDYGYERIVTHDFAACRYPAWIDRMVLSTAN